MKSVRTCIFHAISVVALFGLTNAALAQATLEEITVTAQKREQSLQDVPVTVATISAADIQDAGIATIQDIEHLVPALNIYNAGSPALASIAIRGAGTGASDPTLEPSVGVFIDGVFMPRSIFGLSDLVDVSQIEVLMGPQGTLYGRNTNAGVISVSTKGMPTEFEGFISASGGDFGLRRGELSLGGPVSEKVGLRLGVVSHQRDGTFEHELTGADDINEIDKLSVRGQLFWEPTDNFSTRLIAFHSESDANQGQSEQGFNPNSAYYGYVAQLQGLFGIPAPGTDAEDRRVQVSIPNNNKVEVDGASLQLDYEFGNATFTSITSMLDWSLTDNSNDTDGVALEFLNILSNPIEEEAFSQEFRLTSPGGETIDWLVGLFYFDSDMHRGSLTDTYADYVLGLPGIATPPPVGALIPELIVAGDNALWDSNFGAESWAAFGQMTWNFSDATSLTLGLRYGEEDKDFDVHVSAYDADGTPYNLPNLLAGEYTGGFFVPLTSGNFFEGGPSPITGVTLGGPTDRAGSRSDDNVSGSLSLNHFFGDHMVYASVATGFKSGGFNGSFGISSVDEREFDEEETTNYEIGVKFDGLLDNRARINLAVFHTIYDDFQAATFDPATVQFMVINAGEQRTSGVDIDATVLVTENVSLTARVEYLDAEYEDFTGANCHPLSGETIDGNGQCVLDGQPLEFAADWTGSLAADFAFPVSNTSDIYGRVGFAFKGDHIADPTRAPYARDENYQLWDARIGWRNDRWDISAWGKNLTDETYGRVYTSNVFGGIFGAADAGASTLNYRAWINDPRMWGITVRYDF